MGFPSPPPPSLLRLNDGSTWCDSASVFLAAQDHLCFAIQIVLDVSNALHVCNCYHIHQALSTRHQAPIGACKHCWPLRWRYHIDVLPETSSCHDIHGRHGPIQSSTAWHRTSSIVFAAEPDACILHDLNEFSVCSCPTKPILSNYSVPEGPPTPVLIPPADGTLTFPTYGESTLTAKRFWSALHRRIWPYKGIA